MNHPDLLKSRMNASIEFEIDLFFDRLKRINGCISHLVLRKYVTSLIDDSAGDKDILIKIADYLMGIRYNDLVDIANTLALFSDYRDKSFLCPWFQHFSEKVFKINSSKFDFRGLQKIISTFELLDINVPDDIQNAFNTIINDDSVVKYTSSIYEEQMAEKIINMGGMTGFSIGRNEFILGFEVDIVVYDTCGNIFAIIELDGSHHLNPAKRKIDTSRDQLFYRRGVTDLIIRKSSRGCEIVKCSY